MSPRRPPPDSAPAPADASWERARRPEQKREREATILAAAAACFEEGGLADASLSKIARVAGISKANIYRYFESREAIFLELMVEDHHSWERALHAGLLELAPGDVDGLARLVTRTLVERPRLCALMASLASVLEHNVSSETIAQFKRTFRASLAEFIPALTRVLPELTPERAREFMMYTYSIATGLWPHATPSPVVDALLDTPEFADLRLDFEQTLHAHTHTILRGLLADT